MAKKIKKKVTIVHSHPMRVPISKKNLTGTTIRDEHLRRVPGTYLERPDIESIFRKYIKKNIVYPSKGKLGRTPTAEEIILEYKGLLKSKSSYKNNALEKFQEGYAKLKK